jgi:hypothetical protein
MTNARHSCFQLRSTLCFSDTIVLPKSGVLVHNNLLRFLILVHMFQPNFVHSASEDMSEPYKKALTLVLQDPVTRHDDALNPSI